MRYIVCILIVVLVSWEAIVVEGKVSGKYPKVISTLTPSNTRTPSKTRTPSITRTPSKTRTATSTRTPTRTKTPTPSKTRTATRTMRPTTTSVPNVIPDEIVKGFRLIIVQKGDICYGKMIGKSSIGYFNNTIAVFRENILSGVGVLDGGCFLSGQPQFEVYDYIRRQGLSYSTEYLPNWVATATATPTSTPTMTSTPTATSTSTPTPTLTNTPTATSTLTATSTSTPSLTRTPTSTATNTPTVTTTPTVTVVPGIDWYSEYVGVTEIEPGSDSKCVVENYLTYTGQLVILEFTVDYLGSPLTVENPRCYQGEYSVEDIKNFLQRNGEVISDIITNP